MPRTCWTELLGTPTDSSLTSSVRASVAHSTGRQTASAVSRREAATFASSDRVLKPADSAERQKPWYRIKKTGRLTPTRIRWRIITLLLAISVVTYIDRVNISVTARQMMPALGLTDVQMGQVFSAFFLGYALFQVPGGWFGDRFGPKKVLFVAILWWSLFTACTAIAATLPLAGLFGIFGSLLAVRFLIGVGESMALPNFNRTVANWSAPYEHGLAISLAIGGIGIGSAVTPPITAWMMVNFGWQVAFYVSTGLGLLVAASGISTLPISPISTLVSMR